MEALRYTLVCDGPTDANLIPIINWALRACQATISPAGQYAKYWRVPCKPDTLAEKIKLSLELYPCQILFIHRDAEKAVARERHEEIRRAVAQVADMGAKMPAVAVVPVRMLEAWLLFDEIAIRKAASNPNGRCDLQLPALNKIESEPDPKARLKATLRTASEFTGRRLKKFDDRQAFWRITDYLKDYSPLRKLAAFRQLEDNIQQLCLNHWKPGFYGLAGSPGP